MKKFFVIFIICFYGALQAQCQPKAALANRVKDFHIALVQHKNFESYLHDSLSYGHSNGWIQHKTELIQDMTTKISYYAFSEDSMQIVQSKRVFYARFNATVDASLNGNRMVFKLRVLEVWKKQSGKWLLFARQAIKI